MQILTPIFDPGFSESSFGFRPKRSAQSEEAAKRVFESIGNYLTRKLKLVVNQQKSRTCSTDGVEFLGFIFRGYGGQIRVSPKKIKKFQDRIR